MWGVTEDGKRIPLDAERPPNALVTLGGLSDDTPVVGVRPAWVSHFATCPQAGSWRRGP